MEDLNDIIEDSITDAELPPPDASAEPLEASTEPSDPIVEDSPSIAVPTPAERAEEAAKTPQDDFDKKFGLSAQSSSGRENRIPYSRVKKITEKAVNDAKTDWSKDLTASHVPVSKFQEVETKLKDYEGRWSQVAEFEKFMATDQLGFLKRLYTQPGYKEIFDQLAAGPAQQQAPVQAPAPVEEDFPQPDQQLSDGSKVYSMEGLKALREWDRKQVATAVLKEVETRYAPLEQDYKAYQQTQAVIPQVQRQIEEARTWPLFNESEGDIVKSLQANPSFTLERAYQVVVFPKMKAEQERLAGEAKVSKETMRAELLKELKQAPRSTAAAGGPTRPAPAPTGPRSIEDVIADSIKSLQR